MTVFVTAAACLALLACTPGGRDASAEKELSTRQVQVAERVEKARASEPAPGSRIDPVARWDLPPGLREVSGLSLTPDGRLFAHGDERARIYQVDYRRGATLKFFDVGPTTVSGDFEALAIAGTRVFLVASDATIYEVAEGAAGQQVPFRMIRVAVPGCREIEGATHDPATASLVLACKTPTKGNDDVLLLYQWALDGQSAATRRLAIPFATISERGAPGRRFSASDITRRPDNGNFVLVAGPDRGYLEITPAGEIVVARELPKRHQQAEGVAVTSDGLLLIADEGGKGASLTVYAAPFK